MMGMANGWMWLMLGMDKMNLFLSFIELMMIKHCSRYLISSQYTSISIDCHYYTEFTELILMKHWNMTRVQMWKKRVSIYTYKFKAVHLLSIDMETSI